MTIVAQGVSRTFDGVPAVKHVEFEAAPGRVTALIGPNGAGKTTLLLMLATLLRPDTGSIRIDGFDPVTQTGDVRRRIGWMPDALGAWEGLSCRTALSLTGRMYGLPSAHADERALELLALVGLPEYADRPTRVLSRGQKQKLSLCRALVHDPRVLLLDEPASGLDPAAQVELRHLLLRLAEEGRTILVSSHDLTELETMSPDVVFVKDGVTASRESVERAKSARRGWRIRALSDQALQRALVSLGLIAGDTMSRPNGEMVLGFESDADAAAALGRLVREGVGISLFAPAAGELEQMFLDLARQQPQIQLPQTRPPAPPAPPVVAPPAPPPVDPAGGHTSLPASWQPPVAAAEPTNEETA